MNRRGYLDWLRGVGVLIMIAGHTLDSWTRDADRTREQYRSAMAVAGIGAPIFLMLAGIAMALAAGSRLRRGVSPADANRLALRRAFVIFGLAFLFRMQAWLISGGDFARTLLKVDILNVMGLSMLAAALLRAAAPSRAGRLVWPALAAAACALLTPVVRTTPVLAFLPDPVEWYLRPAAGQTTFTLFPWAGFLLAGAAVGELLEPARSREAERRIVAACALAGGAVAGAGYAASFLPSIYAHSDFWTSSPTFFFLRLGIVVALLPAAYLWNARGGERRSPVRELGTASLFVYWIHVELVYGAPSAAVHRSLTFEQALGAVVGLTVVLYGLVKLKQIVPVGGVTRVRLSLLRS